MVYNNLRLTAPLLLTIKKQYWTWKRSYFRYTLLCGIEVFFHLLRQLIVNAMATCNEQQLEARCNVPFSLNSTVAVLQATTGSKVTTLRSLHCLCNALLDTGTGRRSTYGHTRATSWRQHDPCSCDKVQVQGSHAEPFIQRLARVRA